MKIYKNIIHVFCLQASFLETSNNIYFIYSETGQDCGLVFFKVSDGLRWANNGKTQPTAIPAHEGFLFFSSMRPSIHHASLYMSKLSNKDKFMSDYHKYHIYSHIYCPFKVE